MDTTVFSNISTWNVHLIPQMCTLQAFVLFQHNSRNFKCVIPLASFFYNVSVKLALRKEIYWHSYEIISRNNNSFTYVALIFSDSQFVIFV